MGFKKQENRILQGCIERLWRKLTIGRGGWRETDRRPQEKGNHKVEAETFFNLKEREG